MQPRGSATMQKHLLKLGSYLLQQTRLPFVLAGLVTEQPHGGAEMPPPSAPSAALKGFCSPLLVWKWQGLKDVFVVFQD